MMWSHRNGGIVSTLSAPPRAVTNRDAQIPEPDRRVRYYRDLVAWQQAMALATTCYRVARSFPTDERFCLAAQLRRAAASIPSNIAEGNGRASRLDYLHFLSIARGSLMEVETHLLLAQELSYGEPASINEALELRHRVGSLLNALIRGLRRPKA
jgi:four helix bundle protein